MAKSNRVKSLFCLGTLAFVGGCDAEAGKDYRGEVLLELNGTVESAGAADSAAVPALAFNNWLGITSSNQAVTGWSFVEGKMTGEFPSRFAFKVDQPPPESAFYTGGPTVPGTMARGRLALVPKDHPATLESLVPGIGNETCSTAGPGQSCTREYSFCNAAGACITQQLACVVEACEVIATVGDPARRTSAPQQWTTDFYVLGNTFAVYETFYDPANWTNNYQELRLCHGDNLLLYPFSTAHSTTCTVAQESGDPTLRNNLKVNRMASNLLINYSKVDDPNYPLGPLEVGYNVFRAPENQQEMVAHLQCRALAQIRAISEYNAANDPDFDPNPLDNNVEAQPGAAQVRTRTEELLVDCPPEYVKLSASDEVSIIVDSLLAL